MKRVNKCKVPDTQVLHIVLPSKSLPSSRKAKISKYINNYKRKIAIKEHKNAIQVQSNDRFLTF